MCTQHLHHCYPIHHHILSPTLHWCRSPLGLHNSIAHQPAEGSHSYNFEQLFKVKSSLKDIQQLHTCKLEPPVLDHNKMRVTLLCVWQQRVRFKQFFLGTNKGQLKLQILAKSLADISSGRQWETAAILIIHSWGSMPPDPPRLNYCRATMFFTSANDIAPPLPLPQANTEKVMHGPAGVTWMCYIHVLFQVIHLLSSQVCSKWYFSQWHVTVPKVPQLK